MNAQTKVESPPNVYQCIAAVQAELAKTGIGKNNANTQQNYKFRGIDDVYNALAPLLARHGLCVLPRIISREREERVSVKEYNGQRKESVLFYVTVEAEFDFVSSADGSRHTVRTFGEAMDSGDKATNKAMSAAYKYAAFMTFAIPTEGDNDADATTHEVAASSMPDAEYDKLVHLVSKTNSNVSALLKFLDIKVPNNNLRLLNQAQYGQVLDALNEKLAKLAKAETDAQAKETVDA